MIAPHRATEASQYGSPVVLSIAGSDSCGGAGIQADLRAFHAMGARGATVVTAVTAQNARRVHAVHVMPAEIVMAQLEAVFEDLPIRAVKLGMLGQTAIIEAVAASLSRHQPAFIGLDPVMIATSGARLLAEDAVACLVSLLLPLVDCLTPNLAEAAALLGTSLATSEALMAEQGRALLDLGPRAVLMKGGHAPLTEAVDLLVTSQGTQRFATPWVKSNHLHGTGCTLSAAIVAAVARGASLANAVAQAKAYLTRSLSRAWDLAAGSEPGPLARMDDDAREGSDQ